MALFRFQQMRKQSLRPCGFFFWFFFKGKKVNNSNGNRLCAAPAHRKWVSFQDNQTIAKNSLSRTALRMHCCQCQSIRNCFTEATMSAMARSRDSFIVQGSARQQLPTTSQSGSDLTIRLPRQTSQPCLWTLSHIHPSARPIAILAISLPQIHPIGQPPAGVYTLFRNNRSNRRR